MKASCWCEASFVEVTSSDVFAGRTGSCGLPGCGDTPALSDVRCEHCDRPLAQKAVGRKRKYCGDRCRGNASTARKAAA